MMSTTRCFTDSVRRLLTVVAGAGLLLAIAPGAAAVAQPPADDLESEQRALEEEEADARAAAEDEGNPDAWTKFFYLQGNVGYSYVDLRALRFDALTPEEFAVNGSGVTTGAAVGFRIFLLTLGARVNWASHDQFDLGAVMGELGLRIPNDIAEPFFRLGVGYGWMNEDFDEIREEVRGDPQIDGFMAEVGAGFDFWVHEFVTVGLAIDVAFYVLARDAIEACAAGACPSFENAGEEGDATAIQARVALQVGLVL